MNVPRGVRRALRLPASASRLAGDLDDEVRFHVEMRAKKLEAAGLTPEEAYVESVRRFGDVDDLRDHYLSLEVPRMQRAELRERIFTVVHDARFALRQLRRGPGFAVVSALTLALGIGATTAIFSVVNGVVLQPLPFPHPEQLVQLWGLGAKGQHMSFADPTFARIAADARGLSAVAEYNGNTMTVSNDGDAERVRTSAVSKQFFDVLGVRPAVGRFFVPAEQQLGASPAAVISHALWIRQFGGAPSAVGAKLVSGRTSLTVVGVLPAGREFPAGVDVWLPRESFPKDVNYTAHNWRVVARVEDGVAPEQANRQVSTVLRRLHAAVGDETWTVDGTAIPLREQIVGKIEPLLYLVLAASAVLLLIACTNVANLLIARIAAREGELAVRLALGSGRWRLAQQLLIETALLSAMGCAGGLLLAESGLRVLLALRPAMIPRLAEVHLDWRVLVFAVALSAGTAIGLGLVAAWRTAAGDLRAALSQSQRTHGGGGASYRLRGGLVVGQLAMTVVLLVGAGLLARSFIQLATVRTGFRTHDVVVADLALEEYPPAERATRRAQLLDELADRARATAGVADVGIADAPPFSGGSSNGTFLELPSAAVKLTLDDALQLLRTDKPHTGHANYGVVSSGYFKALNIPVVSGRAFDDADRAGGPNVAVVSAALAKRQWPAESAVGKVIEFGTIDGDLTPLTIVGVVGDTREEDLAAEPEPMVYVSYRQRPGTGSPAMYLVMATTAEAPTISSARQSLRQARPDIPVHFETIEQIIGASIASQRFLLLLVGVFGGVALLLATLGVYSVISFLVAQREKEISIRVALGARAADIVWMVLGRGVVLSVLGAAAGGAAALLATRVLRQVLYNVSATDPLSFVAMLLVLCTVATVASYVPARRAARLDPMGVLRRG